MNGFQRLKFAEGSKAYRASRARGSKGYQRSTGSRFQGSKGFEVSRFSKVSRVSRVTALRSQGEGIRRPTLAYLHPTTHVHATLYFEAVRITHPIHVLNLNGDVRTVEKGFMA